MGCYDVKRMVTEFSKRTWENIGIVEAAKRNQINGAYEVTQMVNSLVGLLVFPYGKYISTKKEDIENIEAYGRIKGIIEYLNENDRLYCYEENLDPLLFIRALRNSVAHSGERGNLLFYPKSDSNEEISHVIFHSGKGNEEFCTMLRCNDGNETGETNELKELTKAVSDLYSEVEKKLSKCEKAQKKYDKRIDAYIELMKKPYHRSDNACTKDDVCMLCGNVPFRDDNGLPYLMSYQVDGQTAFLCPNCCHCLDKRARDEDFEIVKESIRKRTDIQD